MVAKTIDYRSDLINPHNIDNKCDFNTMFKSDETRLSLKNYFETNCIGEASCMITSSMLSEMIADFTCDCRNRIGRKKALPKLMVVYKCSGETISIPFNLAETFGGENDSIGKLEILTFVSILDLVCALILIWTMMSLKAISDDRLDEISFSLVEVKDFVIQLNQLKVDKYSQDERILQMKLWLNINEQL